MSGNYVVVRHMVIEVNDEDVTKSGEFGLVTYYFCNFLHKCCGTLLHKQTSQIDLHWSMAFLLNLHLIRDSRMLQHLQQSARFVQFQEEDHCKQGPGH